MIRSFALSLALCASLAACAAEPSAQAPSAAAGQPAAAAPAGVDATVRAALESLVPGVKVGTVRPAPFAGFQEASIDGRVLYVSNDGKFLIQGALIDVAAKDNLTQASEAVFRKDVLDTVGPDQGIVFAAEQPKYTVKVFTDIDCGYCRRMHQDIAEYNKLGITVEYLFYPRDGIGSEAFDKAVSVWCSPDRHQALTAAKAGATLPKASCTNPVTRDYDVGRRVGLDGTPAVYAENGRQLGGYLPPADMLARLDELAAQAAAKP